MAFQFHVCMRLPKDCDIYNKEETHSKVGVNLFDITFCDIKECANIECPRNHIHWPVGVPISMAHFWTCQNYIRSETEEKENLDES